MMVLITGCSLLKMHLPWKNRNMIKISVKKGFYLYINAGRPHINDNYINYVLQTAENCERFCQFQIHL